MSFMLAGAKLVAATSDTSGSLWYTTFSGGQNIHKVDYNWVGGSLSFANNINLGPGVNGADGLLFLPNGDLAVGGQGRTVHEINPLSGAVITDLSVPTDSFHLSLSPGGKVLYSSSIPWATDRDNAERQRRVGGGHDVGLADVGHAEPTGYHCVGERRAKCRKSALYILTCRR